MPKYTFLLPAYKSRFFQETLESIKQQTFKDFKVIVSDDCSPEPIHNIFVNVCNDDPRFIYRCNEKNIGGEKLVSHWNMLVCMCDTDFLIMAGDDDIYAPTFLEEADRLLHLYPDIDLIRARAKRIDENGKVICKELIYEEYTNSLEFLYQTANNQYINCIGNFVFRREALKNKGGFINFPFAWFSDDATSIIMSPRGVVNTFDILFYFRSSMINISNMVDNTQCARLKSLTAANFWIWYLQYWQSIKDAYPSTSYNDYMINFVKWSTEEYIIKIFHPTSRKCNFLNFIKLTNKFESRKRKLNLICSYIIEKYLFFFKKLR